MDGDKMQEDGSQDSSESGLVDFLGEKLHELLESDQANFSSWTSLITEVEKTTPNDIIKICLAYDSFLNEFPLCYGYWKRYADHKARLCTFKEVEEVYERAVKAATYSVDVWVDYCSFGEFSFKDPDDVRRLYERGLFFVEKDYLCHILWDKYIEFEYSQKQWSHLAHIYINTLRFPTKKLQSYYERFKMLVAIWEEETEGQVEEEKLPDTVPSCDLTSIKTVGYVKISNVIRDLLDKQEDTCRPNNLKKYISVGELLYHNSSQLNEKISFFESRIRRRYFHVKPLDDCQLENWHQYLDFIELHGYFDWSVKLYERCLIPCANYSEFWIRYVEFVEARGGREIANHAIARALAVFLKKVPAFHIFSAMFKEQIGDAIGARASFLQGDMDMAPEFIENVNREANMEKRLGCTESACMIYEKAIELAKEKLNEKIFSALHISFARFRLAINGSIDAAIEVFIRGIQQMPCKSIIEGLIQFAIMHGSAGQISNVDSIIANAISPGSDVSQALNPHDREDISKLFLEFVDLHGTIREIRMVWDRHNRLFPHIMRPSTPPPPPPVSPPTTILTNSASTSYALKNIPLHKSIERKNEESAALSIDGDGDNDHVGTIYDGDNDHVGTAGADMLRNNDSTPNKVAIGSELQQEEHMSGTDVAQEPLEVTGLVQIQSSPLHVEVVEAVLESCELVQVSEGLPETEGQVQSNPCQEINTDLRPPEVEKLTINSPHNETPQPNPSPCADASKLKDGDNFDDVSANHESDLIQVKSETTSQENLQRDSSSSQQNSKPTPTDAQINSEHPVQVQELPADGSYTQNAVRGGNIAQLYFGGQAQENSTSSSSQVYAQPSQAQEWQAPTQLQYTADATNSQVLITPGYAYQPETQQANQTQVQYPMASASQFYQIGNLALSGQNMQQQQAFIYGQPQASTQAHSQPQIQLYQNPTQSSEQYGYFQNSQGVQAQTWQYYQQYYLQQQQQQQQQQIQQFYSQPLQIEHLQQLQQTLMQQQQQHSQNHQPQSQQQNQQVDNTQQQQNLLYLQQQAYLQQQQLYLQQQQQMQLFLQQQQQQQLVQQHQQLSLQQQQQLLQQQQQEEQEQQQTLSVQEHSSSQHGQDYDEQAVASKDEGTKQQNVELSGTNYTSTPQKTPPQ